MKNILTSKTLKPFLALSIALLSIASGNLSASNITVKLENISEQKGKIEVSLFASEDNWLKQPIASIQLEATDQTIVYVFENIEPGEYALSATHDVDENGQLNSGAFGKPTEPYGFSNNARGMFGPAKWKKAKIEVNASQDSETSIVLK